MVSFNVYRSTYSGAYVEGICLATDEKPVVGIANGSILFAVDISTGETTRYMYDQESMSWIEAECPCAGGGSGGSGGGGGSAEPLIVNTSGANFVADKTFGEMYDAFAAGRPVIIKATNMEGMGETITSLVCEFMVGPAPDGSDVTAYMFSTNNLQPKNDPSDMQGDNYPYFHVDLGPVPDN